MAAAATSGLTPGRYAGWWASELGAFAVATGVGLLDDPSAAAAEAARVLRPGGLLVIGQS